jgi:hypothetical protein
MERNHGAGRRCMRDHASLEKYRDQAHGHPEITGRQVSYGIGGVNNNMRAMDHLVSAHPTVHCSDEALASGSRGSRGVRAAAR